MATPVHYLSLPATEASIFDLGGMPVRGPARGAAREMQVARQFEALLLQQWLKQARRAGDQAGLFDSDQTRFVQSLRDEQLALQLANPGLGLAQALLAHIRGEGASVGANQAMGNVPTSPVSTSRRAPLRSLADDAVRNEATEGGPIGRRFDRLLSSVNRAGAALLAAVSGAPAHIERFVANMAPAAQHAARETGLPAALILSQAALESGWGQREIRHDDGRSSHNLFGIKATAAWRGKVADVMTTEYVDGRAQKRVASFRAYDSYHESFQDYARLLSTSQRYQPVREAPTAELAARRLQEAGYATDPRYADKLLSIMRYFRVLDTQATGQAMAGRAVDAHG